jgi:hypothetical protein
MLDTFAIVKDELSSEGEADATTWQHMRRRGYQYDATQASLRYSRLEKKERAWIRNQWNII